MIYVEKLNKKIDDLRKRRDDANYIMNITIMCRTHDETRKYEARVIRLDNELDALIEERQELLIRIRDGNHPAGHAIKMIRMVNDPNPIKRGEIGQCIRRDMNGDLEMMWDSGRTLKIIEGVDMYEVMD